MVRAAEGDQGAFQRFYDASSPALLGLLVRLLQDRFQAEDVLQEAMVIAWRKAGDFDPRRARATTWITTIARRRALDLLRSRNRHDQVLRDRALDIVDQLSAAGEEPQQSADESAATASRLSACFDELKEDSAEAIKLAYLDGLTFSEIATSTRNSLNTVKSWIRRGIGRLRECMHR